MYGVTPRISLLLTVLMYVKSKFHASHGSHNPNKNHNPTRQHFWNLVMLCLMSTQNHPSRHRSHRTCRHHSSVHCTAPLGAAEDRAAQPPYSALALRLLFSCSPSSSSVPCPHYQVSSTCRIRLRYIIVVIVDPYRSCGYVLDGNGALSAVSLRRPFWLCLPPAAVILTFSSSLRRLVSGSSESARFADHTGPVVGSRLVVLRRCLSSSQHRGVVFYSPCAAFSSPRAAAAASPAAAHPRRTTSGSSHARRCGRTL